MLSKPLVRHTGKILNGVRLYDNPGRHNRQLQALEGKRFIELIEEIHEQKTPNQNNYYRGVILPACLKSEFFAHYDSADDIHDEIFAKKFLKYTVEREAGGEKWNQVKYRSTASLNKQEFKEFIEKVTFWCFEHGIMFLSPEEYYDKFK